MPDDRCKDGSLDLSETAINQSLASPVDNTTPLAKQS
jgi:hypothetical protein